MRVVADTNVLISALIFGGLPGALLDLAVAGAFTLVISHPLLDELDEKLRSKFKLPDEDAIAIRKKLESIALLVRPSIVYELIQEDPDDNRVLECAAEGKADSIVSGDRHLLKLEKFQEIPIMRVREFLNSPPLV